MKTTNIIKETLNGLSDLLNKYIIPCTNEAKIGNFAKVQLLSSEALLEIPSHVNDEDFYKVNACLDFLFNELYSIKILTTGLYRFEKASPVLILALIDSLSSMCDAAYNVVFEAAVILNDINKSRCAENSYLIDLMRK